MQKPKPSWLRWLTQNPVAQDSELRWLIADWLNKRRDVCWAEAVMWAMFRDFRDVLDLVPYSRWYGFHSVTTCRKDARLHGSCYCGKFASQAFADEAGLRHPIIVTPTIEPEDDLHGATLVFKGEE